LLKGIIFDFDGVIAESVQVKTDAFATLYEQYGDNIVNKVIEHHEANGGMSRFEKIKLYHESYLKKVINNNEVEELATRFSELVVKKVIDSPYVPGVLDYIQNSHKQYKLFISTGTPTNEMKMILTGRRIIQYFEDVFGSPEIKDLHIEKILSIYKYIPDELIFYGDATVDIDAADKANIPFVLIKNNCNKNLAIRYSGKKISNFNKQGKINEDY
jgi:phosphoglycolate phosphatase-like HAD superfamily hydrolase